MSPYITAKHGITNDARENTSQRSARALPAFNIFFFIAVAAAAVGYVMLLNLVTAQGYEVQRLEKKLRILSGAGERLSRDLALSRSPDALALRAPNLGLVAVERLGYPAPASAVAKSADAVLP